MECPPTWTLCGTQELWATLMYGYCSNFLVCPKLVLLWSVSTWIYAKLKIHAKLKFYGQLTLKSMVNSKFMLNFIFMAWCIARKEPTREGLVRVAMFFDTKWRRGQRPNRLASFFTAARQLVSEVESYFSSDEDGNLDRLELLEGRLVQACETLYDGLFSRYSIKMFLTFVTVAPCLPHFGLQTLSVKFSDQPSIFASTCLCEITLPKMFVDEDQFKLSLEAVLQTMWKVI